MLVRELIDRLESSGLLDHEIIETLRQQLEESGARVTPEAVAKLLVDNGHLTRYQATKLIGELRAGEEPEADAAPATENDLGLADDDSATDSPGDEDTSAAIIVDDDEDDVVEAAVLEDDEPVAEAMPVDAEPVVEDAVVVGGGSGSMGDLAPHPVVPPKRKGGKKNKNVWDSFWIYGIAGIIVLFIGVGLGLVYVLGRESADEYIAKANEAYQNANYSAAREVYSDFVDAYPGDKNVSMARVREGISSIIVAKDSVPDPSVGLEKAKEVLPTIENEDAFAEERDAVSGVLVDIGSALATEADELKLADDKESTLAELDAWFKLLENPMYITGSMRKTLGPRITTIEETRARVVRDIARDRDLTKALADMRAALDDRKTKQAFDVRTELVRRYPRLLDHKQLGELVLEASGIQKELVAPVDSLPEVTQEAIPGSNYVSVPLANQTGRTLPELAGRVVYFRARGSVLAIAADSGNILWRRFVGYSNDNPPVSLGDSPSDGVLLSNGRQGELQRLADNQVAWRAKIGETFSKPIVDRRTIYISTESGRILALDAETGDARWGRQIPQPVHVAPGTQPGARFMYVPGEHSNLYVLDRDNGQCIGSHYIGHDLGTIRVPPVQLLGHLFVFENAGSDYCLVHILRVDEETGQLSEGQQDIRLTGNVVTPPTVQNRRLIMLTDLGQIGVLDVEPSAERKKVNWAAEQVATYDTPTKTEMVVGRNEAWVTGAQIARYELQINTGKVIRDWVKHKGDNFIAAPLLIEGTLIHARQMRGTQGVRITAVNPENGEVIWKNDVGVPVAMLAADADSRSVYAVTSQAALYRLDDASINSEGAVQPAENPGGDGVAMRFGNPLDAGDGRRVLVNQETAKQVVVFDPSRSREKLRLVALSVPENTVTSAPCIMMAGGLLMPLDNGRIVLMNWESGMPLSSPFQPPTQPGQRVDWTTPVANPTDPEQLLICDDSPTLFRLRVAEQIRELSKIQVAQKLLGPAAASQSNWIAAAGGAAGDLLVTYSVTTLEETGRKMMGNRITFGPASVDDAVVLQTADGKLHRINAQSEIQWSIDLPSGQPAAVPMMREGTMYVTGQDGWILAVDAGSGEVTGQVEVGQPLSGNPLIAGTRMLVPGSEGLVFVVETP